MEHHVFLSYSRKDTPFMHRVRKDLTRSRLVVWTDEGIEPGTANWQRAIESAIMQTGCMVCLLSPDAAKSQWVREELNFARLHNKEVFLLMARGDEKISVPFGYSLAQWADIRTRKAYKASMIMLIRMVHERFGETKLSPTTDLPVLPQNFTLAPTGPLIEDPPIMSDLMPRPFDWCDVAAGSVVVDDILYDVERFYLAKYPVTNAQFRIFLDDPHGYRNPQWFDVSNESQNWHRGIRSSMTPIYTDFDLPRSYVNWYEALAYTRWLQERTGTSYQLTLPTEQQWQRAAQGDDERAYPWGREYDKRRCNTLKSGINKPTPVMAYPTGASPYGVFDMCGNVSEWTLSDWEGSQEIGGDASRVVRGGAYDSGRTFSQSTIRNYQRPHMQTATVGFRLCANFPD